MTPETWRNVSRRVSAPGVELVISAAPSAVAVTVNPVGKRVLPVSVSDRVTPFVPPAIAWPGWSVTDAWLNVDVTFEGSPETLRS